MNPYLDVLLERAVVGRLEVAQVAPVRLDVEVHRVHVGRDLALLHGGVVAILALELFQLQVNGLDVVLQR